MDVFVMLNVIAGSSEGQVTRLALDLGFFISIGRLHLLSSRCTSEACSLLDMFNKSCFQSLRKPFAALVTHEPLDTLMNCLFVFTKQMRVGKLFVTLVALMTVLVLGMAVQNVSLQVLVRVGRKVAFITFVGLVHSIATMRNPHVVSKAMEGHHAVT